MGKLSAVARRTRIILFAAPAVLMAGYLLAEWALGRPPLQRFAYQDVDLKSLGNFPLDKSSARDEDIPARFRALDGRRVSVEGFMMPVGPSWGPWVDRFRIVCDLNHPFRRRPPLVQERVFATARPKVPLYSSNELLQMRGVLHVRLERDAAGRIQSVYRMDVKSVTPIGSATGTAGTFTSLLGRLTKWNALAATYLLLGLPVRVLPIPAGLAAPPPPRAKAGGVMPRMRI